MGTDAGLHNLDHAYDDCCPTCRIENRDKYKMGFDMDDFFSIRPLSLSRPACNSYFNGDM